MDFWGQVGTENPAKTGQDRPRQGKEREEKGREEEVKGLEGERCGKCVEKAPVDFLRRKGGGFPPPLGGDH